MSSLSAKDDSFIALLLDLSGRARVSDLAHLSSEAASSLLQQYAAAHPEKSLDFDGQALSAVPSAAPAPTPAPSAGDFAPPPPPPADSLGMVDIGGQPPVDLLQAPTGTYPPPPGADFYGEPSMPLPDAVPAYGAPLITGVPGQETASEPPTGAEYGPPDLAGTYPSAPETSFAAPEYGVDQATYPPPTEPMPEQEQEQGWEFPQEESSDFFDLGPAGADFAKEPVAWYWWFAVLLGGFPGAFLAWFLNRGRPGAKAFLYVAIALLVFLLAAVALLFLLPGIVASMIPVSVPPLK